MSVEIAWKQNIFVTDFHLLKSLLFVNSADKTFAVYQYFNYFCILAACSDPFVEFNDTNCYFVSDDWAQYDDAKTVCHLLESDLYIPPKGNDRLRASLYRQILQYLTYEL